MVLTQEEKDILFEMGIESIMEDYSGRGMYGETTTGVITRDREYLLSNLSEFAEDYENEEDFDSAKTYNVLIRKISTASIDNMGKNSVVIY